jgi:apolipoprotein D and lipocalin family protein
LTGFSVLLQYAGIHEKERKLIKKLFTILLMILPGCVGIPNGISTVADFDINRYLGKWYEIARLDHPFERGLENVSADYSLRSDGGVKVINRGYNPEEKEWKQAEGKAYFVGESNVGQLKVSFFGPFYGGYNIIALDKTGYSYSMVCGPDRSYLWILSRTPEMDALPLSELVSQAKGLGFGTDTLIYVKHEQVQN